MPRINIIEKWWSDYRQVRLNEILGFGTGDGAFFRAARLGQDFNGEPFDTKGLLPEEWVKALIEVGLAEGTPQHFYVKGSKEHFNWLLSCRERASRGGKSKSNKNNGLQEANAKLMLSKGLPSSSSSSSSSRSKNIHVTFEKFDQAPPTEPQLKLLSDKSDTLVESSEKKIKEVNKGGTEDELEGLFKIFPKRSGSMGKAKGLAKLKKFNRDDLKAFERAVKNYLRSCSASQIVGTPFVKQFSTFVNGDWKEWVEGNDDTRLMDEMLGPLPIPSIVQ